MGIITISLVAGMAGYKCLEGMDTIDAFLNAEMLMGGMGPISVQHIDTGKIFAGCYALYCGFVLLLSVAIFLTPIFTGCSTTFTWMWRNNRGPAVFSCARDHQAHRAIFEYYRNIFHPEICIIHLTRFTVRR